MNLKKFSVYTFAGSLIWNSALTYIGIKLGEQWANIRHYSNYFDAVVVVGVIIAIILYIKRTKSKEEQS